MTTGFQSSVFQARGYPSPCLTRIFTHLSTDRRIHLWGHNLRSLVTFEQVEQFGVDRRLNPP